MTNSDEKPGPHSAGTPGEGVSKHPMRHLSDKALARLRDGTELPDLSGTRYRLIGPVARGGMGVVYAAEDDHLQRRVALKVLEVPDSEGELGNRLMREARVLARLEHPGIVPVHDVGTLADGRVFYTMKFVEGQRLDHYIESVTSTPDRLRIFLRICETVAFAHARGVLHRDLKPANVMVGSFGEVLVIDWGLAKILANALQAEPGQVHAATLHRSAANRENGATISLTTGHGRVMGTPGYMSPEQARGEIELLDARSDIFSLGAVLQYLLSKRLGARSSTRQSRSLEAISAKACAQEPERRYASVEELTADVARYLDGLAVAAHRESTFEKLARFFERYKFFILLIAAYLLMRVILVLAIKH
jgi:serine/threonine protein kinase